MVIEKCNRCVGNPACENQVVNECLPVPAFGDVAGKKLQVVTIGLNPALNEYFSFDGNPKEQSQRLGMLNDYGAERTGLSDANVENAKERREGYFQNIDRWWHSYFEKLESVICRVNPDWSYASGSAAHIDLVACATRRAWGDLSQGCQSELLKNCRDHFLATLSRVPNGTILLFDGSTVTTEIYNSGLSVVQEGGVQLINIRNNRGQIGKLKFGEKEFPFRSWSTPASKISPFWRYDLAFWLFGTIYPNAKWFGRGNISAP
jgi:hypothetical protein